MPAFISNLPVWVLVLAGLALAWIGFKYWKYKKATKYAPKIANLEDSDFRTDRDMRTKAGE
jgi:hypothetical protein